MSDATAYRRSPGALWRRVGDRVLLAEAGGSDVGELSVVASAAWLALDRPMAIEELAEELAARFGEAPAEARGRVDRLLGRLEREGWVLRAVADG